MFVSEARAKKRFPARLSVGNKREKGVKKESNSFGISSLNVHSTERSFVWGLEKSKSFSIFKMSRIVE